MELKDIQNVIETKFSDLEAQVKESTAGAETKAQELFNELKSELDEIKSKGVDAEYVKNMQNQLDAIEGKVNAKSMEVEVEEVSFKQAFKNVGSEIAKKYASLSNSGSAINDSFEIKAAGAISFANFGTGAYEAITTQTNPGVYTAVATPNLWLRNIFPNASTTSEVIQYLKYTGGEGAAAIWDERAENLAEKPLVDTDFVKASDNVVWIAGVAHTHRGMLMDAAFLNSFIPQQLVYGDRGILVAENAYIWAKLVANSTAYNGTRTVPVERVYDALAQLGDKYFIGTHILMNHRDVVNEIAFNQASGSGEYDLPNGTVTVVNGQLVINGVTVIASPIVPKGKFMAIDNRVGIFYNRLSPEVQMSTEHDKNFTKNMVTFRAEERVALAVLNNAGIIYGDLSKSTTTTTTTI